MSTTSDCLLSSDTLVGCAVRCASTANSNLRALLDGRRSLEPLGPSRASSLPSRSVKGQVSRSVSQASSGASATRSVSSASSLSTMSSASKANSIVKQHVALFSGARLREEHSSSDIVLGGSAASEHRARAEARGRIHRDPSQWLETLPRQHSSPKRASKHPSVSSKTSWTSSDAAAESAYLYDDEEQTSSIDDVETLTTVAAVSRPSHSARSQSPRKAAALDSRLTGQPRPLSESLQILGTAIPAYEALLSFRTDNDSVPTSKPPMAQSVRPASAAPFTKKYVRTTRETTKKSVAEMLAQFELATSQETLPLTGTFKLAKLSHQPDSLGTKVSQPKRNSAPPQPRAVLTEKRSNSMLRQQGQAVQPSVAGLDGGRYDELMYRLKQRSSGTASRRSGRSSSHGSVIVN